MPYTPDSEKLAALRAGCLTGNLYVVGALLLRVGTTTVRLRPTAPAGQPLQPSTVRTCTDEADFDAFLATTLT